MFSGNLAQDLRYCARTARKNPWSTFAAFLTLTVGIGATTAVFSVINGVMLRPLPVKDADRVVRLFESNATTPRDAVSMEDYLDWKRQLKSFESLGLYGLREANLTGSGEPKHVVVYRCESSVLPVLGVAPALGRNFRPEENEPGHDHVAILSWALWRARFGGQDVLGRKIFLENQPYTIVGVLPKNLYVLGDDKPDLWVPVPFDLSEMINTRGYHWYTAVARLKPGVSLNRANSELAAVAAGLAAEYPKQNAGVSAIAIPLRTWLTRSIRPALMMLLGAVTCVLLIALGNVANLLLVRTSARQREMSVRIAIGATRARLVRQLLTESILLSSAAALAGFGFAAAAIHFVKSLSLDEIRNPEQITMDWRVLLFAVGTGLLTGIAFGLAPVARTWGTQVNASLKESSGRTSDTRAQQRLRQLFVLLQTAMATVLLIDATLLIQSFAKASGIDPGFQPDHVLTMQLSLPESRYRAPGAVGRFAAEVVDSAQSLPGVESAALTSSLPLLSTGGGSGPIWIEGKAKPKNMWDSPTAQFNRITPGYFQTMKIPMLRGRAFNERDRRTSARVGIVNQEFVRQFFAGEDPIGKRIKHLADHADPIAIVGEVGNVRQQGVEKPVSPELFTPLSQEEDGVLTVVARVTGNPLSWAKPLEAQIHRIDTELPLYSVKAMRQIMAEELGWRAFHTFLLMAFAGIAILLAAVGIYAVIAYSAARRISEIGIRMAIGAQKEDILRMIVRQGVTPALLGSVAGVALSFAATGLLSNLLFGVQATDWRTYVAVVILLTAVATAGSYVPARRAAGIDAWRALRHE